MRREEGPETMKILAVDDDESIRMLLESALTPSGNYDLTTAGSAKEVLETIDGASSTFDCFLVDIQMPDVNGIDLTKMIRQTPEYGHQPILMLTAMREKAYLDRAFMAGATDYVSKPFDFTDLYSRISDARKFSLEKTRLVDQSDTDQNIRWTLGIAKDKVPDQVIGRADVDGLIEYGEFDNYLLELARSPQQRASVIALKIAAPMLGHVRISLNEFSAIMREVILCVRATLPDRVSSMCYRGNGTLFCVLEKQLNAPRDMIENEINARFLAASINANFSKMRIFLGDAIPLRATSDTDVLDILWSVVDSVEGRVVQKRDTAAIARRLLRRSLLSEEQRRLERKAYKSVMKDMLPDVDGDSWLKKLYSRSNRQNST
jgi:CheY-like chemotaxis protein